MAPLDRSDRPGSSMLRGGGVVLTGVVVWNASNYAFFLIAGRVLGPEDYGLVAALLAATLVIAVPAQSLQYAVARLIAAPPGGDAGLAEGIYRRAWRRCTTVTPVVTGIAWVAILVVVGRDGDVWPLIATVALVTPLGFFFLALGRLQGEQRFTPFSVCFALWGAPRPIALVPLAALGLGVYAALGATALAVASALTAAVLYTRGGRPAREPSAAEWRRFARPLVPVVVGLAGMGLLINLDVIVAKVALAPDEAGQFAAAATLAKAVFLVPQAVSFVLMPRVAARSAAAEDSGMLLGLGVGVTLVAGGLASVVLWLAADPLLQITYGDEFTASAGFLGAYAAASTLLGALIVAINHHVGRSADRFVWAAAGIAVLQGLLFLVLHDSGRMIVAVDAVTAAAGLLLHEWVFFRTDEAIGPGLVRAVRRSAELRHGGNAAG